MNNILKTALFDFVTGLVAIFIVFLFVRFAKLNQSGYVMVTAMIYLVAGLLRGRDKGIPLLTKLMLITLFGIIYIPIMGESYTTLNLPYPVAAILCVLIGIWISRYWTSFKIVKTILVLVGAIVIVVMISLLCFPYYFQFWLSYAHGEAPEFEFQTLSGEKFYSASIKGKVILLDFWDAHCGPCIQLMPEMEKLYWKHKENPDLVMLMVNAGWESLEAAREFVTKHNFNLLFVYDGGSKVAKKMNVFALPTTIIIDKDYQYHFKHVGYNAQKDDNPGIELDHRIEKLLAYHTQ